MANSAVDTVVQFFLSVETWIEIDLTPQSSPAVALNEIELLCLPGFGARLVTTGAIVSFAVVTVKSSEYSPILPLMSIAAT